MTAPKSANPATDLVNGVRSSEQVAATLGIQATPSIVFFQANRPAAGQRTRLVYAGWVTIRLSDGRRRSIPVFRRRKIQIVAMRGLQ
jgi:hypothetical protein